MKGNLNIKLALFIFIISCTATFGQGSQKFKVVLDAGHGGKDYGCIYHGFVEKNIALNTMLKVGKILEKDPDIDVVYTRKTDVFLELDERTKIANDNDASIFVSIHCNGAANETAYGTETYVMGLARNAYNLEVAKKENDVIFMEKDYKVKYAGYDPNSPESVLGAKITQEVYMDQSLDLASKIEEGISTKIDRKSRGVKQAGFFVLRGAYMPRVLVELGFISNLKEGTFLNSDAGQDKVAKSIANAILDYKKEYYIPIPQTYKPPVIKDTKPETQVVPQDEAPAPEKTTAEGVVFKVQIAASGKDLETVPSNFNGLDNVTKIKGPKLYKYYYGATDDYNQAKGQLLEQAKAKGFTSAFIVAFRDGKNISIEEALK